MTSMKKRIAALALALVMCIGMLPGSAFATEEELENAASTVVTGVEGNGQESGTPESTTPETETATGDQTAIAGNSATVPEGTVIETEDQEEPPAAPAAPATQDDLDAAFEKVGETDDVDTALAALDEYLAVYDRLSDEDKAANAEALAMAQAYRDSLVAGKEAGENGEEYEDPDIKLLYGPFDSVPVNYTVSSYGAPFYNPSTKEHSVSRVTFSPYVNRSDVGSDNANGEVYAYFKGSNEKGWQLWVRLTVGNYVSDTSQNAWVYNKDMSSAYADVTFGLSFNTPGGVTVYGVSISGAKNIHTHDYTVQGTWKTAPDCIHDGVAYFTCSCGQGGSQTKTVTGSKLGHSFPTTWNDGCTSHEDAGCTQHSHVCTRCNGNLSGGTETATHTYPTEWTEVTPPTTTSKGREKKVCTACGHTIYQDIDKLEEPTTASYTVNWYDTEGNVLKGSETRNGTVGTTVSATDKDKSIDGYTYTVVTGKTVESATLAASGTVLKLYFTKNVKTKTIPVTPVVHFRVEGENATQLTKEQIAQNYSITFTYTDEDGEQTQTLTPSTDGATWGTTDSGTLSLTWNNAFKVKIKEVDGRVDLAIAQGAYTVGEVNYVRTQTPNKSDSRDGSGAVHTTSSAYTVKFWVTNYYELPKATVTWYDEDGLTKLDGPTEFVKGTTEPTTSVIPTKAENENYTYTFKEWVKMDDSTEDAIKYKATYTATPKAPVNPDPTYAIKVTKALNTTRTVKNGDVVEYTVTVTNKSSAPLYNLAIDDTADVGLSLKEIVSATYKNGESTTNITLPNVKTATENRKTVNTWEGVLPEFAVGGVVTLTYKATVTNEGTAKVTLANVAHAKGFKTAPTAGLNSAKSVAPVGIMLLSNDGYDVEDSSSSSATVVIPPAKDYVEDWSDERTDAEGTGSNGGTKVDVDPSDPTPVDPNAPVEITKTADKTTDVKVGDVITYTVKITNKTEDDLTVKVKDTLPEGLALGESINIRGAKSASGSVTGTGTVVTPENIADILAGINHHKATSFDNLEVTIGAGKIVELTYTATVQEGATGKLTNKATATVEGKSYEATADVTVKGEEPGPGPDDPTDDGKGISITKTRTSAETAKKGDKITWNIVVKNESNVEKTVTLTELDGVSLSKTSVTLAAGASETVTAEYTVTGNETVDAEGKFFNTVKGSTGKTGDKENPEAKDDGTKIDKSEDPETVTVTWKSGYGDNVDLKVKNDHVKGAEVIQGDYPANPTRPGNYAFNGWGTPVVDPVTGNITITATWRYTGGGGNNDRDDDDDDRDPTPTPTPTPSTEPSVEPTPAPSTEPTPAPVEEELNDQETPLTDIPEVEDLEDQETPLAGLPEELEEMEDLEDQDVPLAEAPQTGDPASLWGMAAGLSGAGFLLLSKGGKKKEEEED